MCDNSVSYFIPRRYDYREVFTPCGNTNPYGGRAICAECRLTRFINRNEASVKADNEAARSAGYGEF